MNLFLFKYRLMETGLSLLFFFTDGFACPEQSASNVHFSFLTFIGQCTDTEFSCVPFVFVFFSLALLLSG